LGWNHVFYNNAFDFRSFAAVSFSVVLSSTTEIELEAITLGYIFVNNFGTNAWRCSTSNHIYTFNEC
jgi:hypothetical protein